MKMVWGGITTYPRLFGMNVSSWFPTLHYKLDLVFVIDSSDWTLSLHHREFAYFSPLITGLFSHPQEGL